jgi:hypothetical protein
LIFLFGCLWKWWHECCSLEKIEIENNAFSGRTQLLDNVGFAFGHNSKQMRIRKIAEIVL